MIVELPLWLIIVLLVMIFIVIIHLSISDFIAKVFYRILKDKLKDEEEKDNGKTI